MKRARLGASAMLTVLAAQQSAAQPADSGHARFVAPGAPRTDAGGIRANF